MVEDCIIWAFLTFPKVFLYSTLKSINRSTSTLRLSESLKFVVFLLHTNNDCYLGFKQDLLKTIN